MYSRKWYYLVSIPLCLIVGGIHKYANLSIGEVTFLMALAGVIAARLTRVELLEWKSLLVMLALSLAGILLYPFWESGKMFSQLTLWLAILSIPMRATLPPADEKKR